MKTEKEIKNKLVELAKDIEYDDGADEASQMLDDLAKFFGIKDFFAGNYIEE